MKNSEVQRGIETLKNHLSSIPFIQFVCEHPAVHETPSVPSQHRWDALVRLSLPLGEVLAAVVWKPNGESGNIRLAAQELQTWRNQLVQGKPGSQPAASSFAWPYGILVAPYLSPRGAQICRDLGIGYCDLAGNCFLSFGQVYILRENWPNPLKRTTKVSLWAAKSERVLRVLLEHPTRAWKTQDLAREAGVSMGLVSSVRSQLTDREWIEKSEGGFSPREPLLLLQEWAAHRKIKRADVRLFYSLEKTGEIEHKLASWSQKHAQRVALTEYSGAARLASYARYSQVAAYVEGDIETLRRDLDLRTTPSGANVRLLVPRDEGVFYGAQTLQETPVAAAIQVYLDLKALGGRSEEAAQHLLEKTIQPRWKGQSR